MTTVALRKESVDRNADGSEIHKLVFASLSARRAWIEIQIVADFGVINTKVALRKESVDRNAGGVVGIIGRLLSLSARRAWIEIYDGADIALEGNSRSPQGERG